MKQYNHSLDLLMCASIAFANNKTQAAASMMRKAVSHPSYAAAVRIITASNQEALVNQGRTLTTAQKRRIIKAESESEGNELDNLTTGLDELDNEADEDEVRAAFGEEGEPEVVEDEAIEQEDGEVVAAVLARMKRAENIAAVSAKAKRTPKFGF